MCSSVCCYYERQRMTQVVTLSRKDIQTLLLLLCSYCYRQEKAPIDITCTGYFGFISIQSLLLHSRGQQGSQGSHEFPPVVSVRGHHHCFLNVLTAPHQNVVDPSPYQVVLVIFDLPPSMTVVSSYESPPVVSVHGHQPCFLNVLTTPHQNVVDPSLYLSLIHI